MTIENKIIELRKQGLSYKKIKNELNCAISTISYHCKKNNINSYNKLRIPSNNEIVKFKELYDKYHSTRIVGKLTGYSKSTISKYVTIIKKIPLNTDEKKKSNIKSVVNWRKKRKIELVNYKGGKCEICGYDKCINALEFHHKDPSEKDFNISSGNPKNNELLYNEVDKCMLVCSNCHKEIHYELIEE